MTPLTPEQAAEFARRIDRYFAQLRNDRPPLIGQPEHPTTLLRDIREALQ